MVASQTSAGIGMNNNVQPPEEIVLRTPGIERPLAYHTQTELVTYKLCNFKSKRTHN